MGIDDLVPDLVVDVLGFTGDVEVFELMLPGGCF